MCIYFVWVYITDLIMYSYNLQDEKNKCTSIFNFNLYKLFMMKKITLLLALLLVSVGFAQQTVIQDFEADGGLGDSFGAAAASVVADPETGGTRGQVAMLSANAGGQVWQGININISENYELVGNNTMQMDVYSLTAIEFAPKAQGGTDGAPDSVSSAAHTGSGWETLTITYDKSLDGKVPANGVYSELALHYLWDIAGNTWATPDSRVFYIDNIKATIQKTVIQDFEADGGLGDAFGDAAASVVADPETGGTRGQVAMLSANAGGQVWQGININISENYELVGNNTMQMDVYSLTAIEFAPKAQGGTDGAPDSVSSAAHTGSGWETLTITYDKSLDGKVPANGVYSELALHYLWDIAGNTWATPDSRVFYIDNIKAVGTVTPADATLPASASPAVPASIIAGTAGTDYISIFSDDLTSINVGNFDPSWSQATDASIIENEGDNILRYANLNYQGTDFNNDKQDVSGMGFLHLDYHTTNSTALQFSLIVEGQESAYDIQANDGITTGSWVSLDIPLSEFTTDLTTLREIKVVGDGTIYFDNWYFHGTATTVSGPDLIITGAFDGTLSGGTPKGIELFVVNDISDLSIYGVGSANNGGGSDGNEFTFPADAVVAGTFLYVATEASNFEAFFGMAPNYTSGAMAINGDDAVELFKDDAVIETFGDIDTDGNGEPWEYLDGWAYRNSGTESDGTFVITDWAFSGVDGLEGGTDNASATSPFPIGTFTVSATAGISDNKLLNISMYPNPTSSRLTISAQSTIKSAAIYNLLGKEVMNLEINKNSESIDVSNLASGMYLIRYSLDNAIGTAKFIKQ